MHSKLSHFASLLNPIQDLLKKKKKVGKKAHNKQPNTHNSANKTAALITAA